MSRSQCWAMESNSPATRWHCSAMFLISLTALSRSAATTLSLACIDSRLQCVDEMCMSCIDLVDPFWNWSDPFGMGQKHHKETHWSSHTLSLTHSLVHLSPSPSPSPLSLSRTLPPYRSQISLLLHSPQLLLYITHNTLLPRAAQLELLHRLAQCQPLLHLPSQKIADYRTKTLRVKLREWCQVLRTVLHCSLCREPQWVVQ